MTSNGYVDLDAQLPYHEITSAPQIAGTDGNGTRADVFGRETRPPTQTQNGAGADANNGAKKDSIWTIEHWAQYFNVDSNQVMHRIQSSFFPYGSFFELIEGNPDLWGPFWIPASLVVVIFAANYLATAIAAAASSSTSSGIEAYDFTRLTAAALVICVYGTVIPLVVYLACRRWKVALTLIEVLSVYGYSWSIWIPVAAICIPPLPLVRWITIMVAAGISGLFISRNIVAVVSKQTDKKNATLTGIFVLCCHFALALLYKFMFFHV